MKKITLIFILLVILIACTPVTGQTPVQPERVEEETLADTADSQPDSPVSPAESSSTEAVADEAVEPAPSSMTGALITLFQGGHILKPVNPLTGEDIPGYTPLELGRNGLLYTYSADGRTLAVIAGSNNQLSLIDLATWQQRATDLHFYEVHGISFSPDGAQLAITYNGSMAKLAVVDVANGTRTADTTLLFQPRWNQVYFTPDSAAIILYGIVQPRPTNEFVEPGPAHVALFNTADLSVAWDTELTGLLDGVTCETEACDKPEDPRTAWEPAVILAPDGRSLYIVHANQDQLTAVNLAEHTVQTMPIAPALSWLDRLIALTADTVHAKEFDFVRKSAVLSADGSRLYVVGWHSDLTADESGNPTYVEKPLGLQVIDTATGTQLASSEIGGNSVYLSPDGSHLFIIGWEIDQSWTKVVDVNTLETVKHLDGYGVWPAIGLDGQPLLLASEVGDSRSALGVLDPASFELLGEWSKPGYVDWVVER